MLYAGLNTQIFVGYHNKHYYLSQFSIMYPRYCVPHFAINPYVGILAGKYNASPGSFISAYAVRTIKSYGVRSSVAIECYEYLCRAGFIVNYKLVTRFRDG